MFIQSIRRDLSTAMFVVIFGILASITILFYDFKTVKADEGDMSASVYTYAQAYALCQNWGGVLDGGDFDDIIFGWDYEDPSICMGTIPRVTCKTQGGIPMWYAKNVSIEQTNKSYCPRLLD